MVQQPKDNRQRGWESTPAALFIRGLSLATKGQISEAAVTLSQALLLDPSSAEGHNNLGLVLQRLGKLDQAVVSFQRALTVRPDYALAHSNLGAALIAMGEHEDAMTALEASLFYEPKQTSALTNAGAALVALGRNEAAIERFGEALMIDPDLIAARLGLAHALKNAGRLDEAIEAFSFVLTLVPGHIDGQLQLAALLLRTNRHDDALQQYSQLLAQAIDLADAWSGQGRVLQEVGRIEEAREAFRRAITAEPRNFRHYLSLANSTRLSVADPAFIEMLGMVDLIDALPKSEQISAHFALGKALTDVDRHQEGFQHLLKGNELRRSTLEYDEQRTLRGLQNIKDTFSIEYLNRWPAAIESETPIFIVGMPRSGSTLVEQILAAHPDIICAGESSAFRDALRAHGFDPIARLQKALLVPTSDDTRKIADSYLQLVRASLDRTAKLGAMRITDKMLNNFRYIGLITRIFPKAKIIHTFRDPVESCLSAFRINFDAQPFAFNLGELGRYYRSYSIIMRHWRRVLPEGTIFDVRYEAVANDLEASARAIVAHCGLQWSDACLRFHEVDRPVKTASVEQVRRPIYQTSIRTARPNATVLRPLLVGLGIEQAQ